MDWWSAQVRIVVMHEHDGALEFNDCVFLFRSPKDEWDLALQSAIAAGRSAETSYDNSDGERVDWRLKEVLTLDYLGRELVQPVEVHSCFRDPDRQIPADTVFNPEASQPTGTGVPFASE